MAAPTFVNFEKKETTDDKARYICASYTAYTYFKVPEGFVLTEDNWNIKWDVLSLENPDGTYTEVEALNDAEEEMDWKRPADTTVGTAKDFGIDEMIE